MGSSYFIPIDSKSGVPYQCPYNHPVHLPWFYHVNNHHPGRGGTWVAQSVKCPTSAQVMISQSVSSSPTLGSVLTAQSLEPASDSVSTSLSAPPLLVLCLPLSQK